MTATGGKVRVFPPGGGTTRAELIAEGASGASNAGRLELGNGRGSIVVQAGSIGSGRGMVSTGPYDAGVAGTMGGGLKPASSLLGSLKSK